MNPDDSRSLDSQINAALVRLGVTGDCPELVRLLAEGLDKHGHDHHELSDLTYWSDIDVARGALATELDLVLCQHIYHSGVITALSLDLPERCANLCFGGAKLNRLFMAASQSIYALYVNTQGAVGG